MNKLFLIFLYIYITIQRKKTKFILNVVFTAQNEYGDITDLPGERDSPVQGR